MAGKGKSKGSGKGSPPGKSPSGGKRRRGRGGSLVARAVRLLFWSSLALVGLLLAYEAWRFPDIGRVGRENPVPTALMRRRAEEARAAGKTWRPVQTWVPLGRISPHLRRAAIAAEDARFFEHEGFDTEEIKDALEDRLVEGKRLRGASTISQQVAKNLWLGPERSWLRKAREAVYTWALERRIPKERILEIYLNVAEWGSGVFGAEAAARRYFAVSAAELGPRQAALLAAALPNPRVRDPGHPSAFLERRARRILRGMGVVDLLGADPGEVAPAGPASGPEAEAPEARGPETPEPRAGTDPGSAAAAATASPSGAQTPLAPITAVPEPAPSPRREPVRTPTPRARPPIAAVPEAGAKPTAAPTPTDLLLAPTPGKGSR